MRTGDMAYRGGGRDLVKIKNALKHYCQGVFPFWAGLVPLVVLKKS
jgi:hypothetical protein